MNELVQISLMLLAGFGGGTLVGYLYGRLFRRADGGLQLKDRVRISFQDGVARATLVAKRDGEYVFGPLVQRMGCAAPKVGQRAIVQSARDGGKLYFRALVKEVEGEPFRLVLTMPERVHNLNKRNAVRHKSNEPAQIDSQPCRLLDIGEGGARIAGKFEAREGDRVSLWVGDREIPAWVVARENGVARVRFEDALS